MLLRALFVGILLKSPFMGAVPVAFWVLSEPLLNRRK
jgi:hypothetical protein